MPLPPLSPPPAIHERLGLVFPEGTANRNYVTREIAAKTVFVMLYAGAVEGNDTYAPLLVFVEVVATDGPMSEARQTALMSMAADAGFHEEQVAFVTAYDDRDAGAVRRSVGKLAWRSFAWFMSEPDHVMAMHRGSGARQVLLSELMGDTGSVD